MDMNLFKAVTKSFIVYSWMGKFMYNNLGGLFGL